MRTHPSFSMKLCPGSTALLLHAVLGISFLPLASLAAPSDILPERPHIAQKYAALPMSFESNQGQDGCAGALSFPRRRLLHSLQGSRGVAPARAKSSLSTQCDPPTRTNLELQHRQSQAWRPAQTPST
jgi:hypothetical protein